MMAEAVSPTEPRKSGRMLWLWIGAFGLLALLGAFCWLVLKPYLEVREAVEILRGGLGIETEMVERLGGPRAAANKLVLYSRLPDRLAPNRIGAMWLMGWCGSEAVPRLLELLKSENLWMRKVAANVLGNTGDQRAVEPLIAALRDQDDTVRRCAAEALKKLRGEEAGK
jgi:hypothetical protein